jgi:RNA polymerase sigma-70 factor (sigma-E family)
MVLTGDVHLAEDVVQDVLVRVHGRWRRIEAVDRPELYVKRMVTNEYLSWRRRWSTRHLLLRSVEDQNGGPPLPSTPDFTTGHADRAELLQQLASLPRRQQAVLVLRYYEGLSDPEIAGLLGCATGTVRSSASRALKTLRALRTAAELTPVEGDRL